MMQAEVHTSPNRSNRHGTVHDRWRRPCPPHGVYGNKASMYPLRHVNGTPCTGMLGAGNAARRGE